MPIHLYNTLTKKKEEFKPVLSNEVKMYHCGPTVYDFAHIGNLRAYVFADTLRRMFEANKYKVTQVINITDVGHLSSDADSGEDKMTKALKREGKPFTLDAMKEVADFYAEKFKEDLHALNIKTPNAMPKASEHIGEDIEIIKALEAKNFVYKTSDGLYFDTAKFPAYGKLGGGQNTEAEGESRIGENKEKRSHRDFALWKFNDKRGWETPWGKGFPGWHVECSAMARKYLGQPFDVHTGGIDHISIHHNNEIAQSECAYGVPLANYWMHNEFLTVAGGKMAKSEGNILTLRSLAERELSPLAYRYTLLTGHYRTPIAYSLEAIEGSQNAYRSLVSKISSWPDGGNFNIEYYEKCLGYISDDLETPKAIALIWEITKDLSLPDEDKKATILKCDNLLGLALERESKNLQKKINEIPANILELLKERNNARDKKNWKEADDLRQQIEHLGYKIKDGSDGSYLDIA